MRFFNLMRDSKDAIKAANKLINVEEIADLKEELDDALMSIG